ncbi:hypothetical protein [Corynebacterium sp. HMSC30G07]|uniref:hypothetical protein n=1 Tax=Corynebacterium sp. HMSC30G07 TaxID=1581072 RepID=UPI00114CD259|nr:hypothetical protein [Corynebacterium sp. HMSC30G07]
MNEKPHRGMDIPAANALVDNVDPSRPGLFQLSPHYWVSNHELLSPALATHVAACNPQRIQYLAPARLRAAAHALAHPNFVLTGFGALALYGLPFLVEGCDITFLADGFSRAQRASLLQPGVRRGSIPGPDVWLARCRGTRVQVASPALATMQALKLVRRGTSRWPVVSAPGKDDAFTRAVQLIDATRRHLHVDPTKVLAAGQQHIDMLWLSSVIGVSSGFADSPKESEMRLIAQFLADKHGLLLEEQVTIWKEGRIVTTFDLVLIDMKRRLTVGLMYDGAHHWDKTQRNKDASINLEVTLQGWTPLRYSDETLPQMYGQLDRLFQASGGAVQ